VSPVSPRVLCAILRNHHTLSLQISITLQTAWGSIQVSPPNSRPRGSSRASMGSRTTTNRLVCARVACPCLTPTLAAGPRVVQHAPAVPALSSRGRRVCPHRPASLDAATPTNAQSPPVATPSCDLVDVGFEPHPSVLLPRPPFLNWRNSPDSDHLLPIPYLKSFSTSPVSSL
jgi:hypothetical protein